jgi:CRP-like cAMP-binding protein
MFRSHGPLKNNLLASLSPDDYALVAGQLTQVDLEKGRLLYDPGDRIDTVYFPLDCVISLMTLMESGAAIESATVGREGGVGLLASLSPRHSLCRAIVQVPGRCARMGVGPMTDVVARSPGLRSVIERHNDALFGHAIQSVACNALHSVEARFCRWLLSCRDRIDSDTINLTQEFLADMLGVQRTTVTAVAGALQAKGLISYRRGVVDILDRPGLEAVACECYGAVRRIYQALLPNSFSDTAAPASEVA